MFKPHTNHTAACTSCGAVAIDPATRYTGGHPQPLTITSNLASLELSTADHGWLGMYDGTLLCDDCAEDRAPDTAALTWEALTAGSLYTLCCDQCAEPALEEGEPIRWEVPELSRWDVMGLEVDGWRVEGTGAVCGSCVPAAALAGGLS